MRLEGAWSLSLAACLLSGCFAEEEPPPLVSDVWEDGPDRATIDHPIGDLELPGFAEQLLCASWTLNNEQPLYVETVLFANEGSFHHSNWYIVPQDVYAGPDGYWDCETRGFEDLAAAQTGGVLFAQSTQAWGESQRFPQGAVIRIPERSKIIGDLHLLNLSPQAHDTGGRLAVTIVHPRLVERVLSPFQLTYLDLLLPPRAEVRHAGECDVPLTEIYYLLPHYHGLGNYFDLSVVSSDGVVESIFRVEGFDAESRGATLWPPIILGEGERLRFTCGHANWTNQQLGWGIGLNEMCVLFGYSGRGRAWVGSVDADSLYVDLEDGVPVREGPCSVLESGPSDSFRSPRLYELRSPLYVPPLGPGDQDSPPQQLCRDADPSAAPLDETNIESLRANVFAPACSFSSCHGASAAAGLDLTVGDLSATLLEHTVQADTDLPLVSPGDPEGSWLYQLISRCEPRDRTGQLVAHMPRNAPVLLDDTLIATVRAWIETQPPAD